MMTNEIKEIIEYLKDDSMFIDDEDGTRKELTLDESTLLLNYISDLEDTIINKNNCIEAYDCILENRDKRIDKALEYIKEHTIHDTPKKLSNGIYERGELIRTCDFYIEDLLDILRGDE